MNHGEGCAYEETNKSAVALYFMVVNNSLLITCLEKTFSGVNTQTDAIVRHQ